MILVVFFGHCTRAACVNMSLNHGFKFARTMGKIACIFGIPALVTLFGGLLLHRYFGVERRFIFFALAGAFALSWILMWRFYLRNVARASEILKEVGEKKVNVFPESDMVRYNEPGVWQSKK